jgi:DNA-binding transcriptional LysR family regulator
MELRHLRYFVAVAEELHFSRAAARLHVAQPAVSEQIRKLEQELGVRLLNRANGTVSVTEAGAVLLTEARRVLQQVEVARLSIENARDRTANRLRIGYSPMSLPTSVTTSLRHLAASIPNLQTILEPGHAVELIAAVRDERLDAAVVSLPAPTNGLRTTALGAERAIAALPIGHRHAVQETINLNRIAPERIVVLPRESNPPFYDAVVAACRRAGLSPSLIETSSLSVEPALIAVTVGAGMALVPESVAQRYRAPGVRFVPIGGDELVVATAVVTRRETTHTATAAFLRAIAQADLHLAPAPSEASVARAA